MALFMSKSEREAREKVAIQMGRKAIRDYLGNCRGTGQRYGEMARKALRLRQRAQAEHYVATQLQYENQCHKWEAFLLKIDDLMLRGTAMSAMSGLMNGLSHLCQNLSRGLSAKEVARTMVRLQEGMTKVDQAEAQLGTMLSGLSLNVGPDTFEMAYEELPPELKEEVTSICDNLTDELKLETEAGADRSTAKAERTQRATDPALQDRINTQLERLRKLRQAKP